MYVLENSPFTSLFMRIKYIVAMPVMILFILFGGITRSAMAGCEFNPLCNPILFVCCTLDREGQGGSCLFECPINDVHFVDYHSRPFTAGISYYEFEGQSLYRASGTAACPPGLKKIKGKAIWEPVEGIGGIASEEIWMEAEFVSEGWSKMVLIKSNCKTNPWLNENATCTLISKEPAESMFPEPFPRSAKTLTETMRQSLILAEFIKVPPVIISPESNSEIKDGKVIFTAFKFVPDASITTGWIEVVFETLTWPGSSDHKKVTKLIELNGNYAMKLVELDVGSWAIKARVNSTISKGPWSHMVHITIPEVKTNSMKMKLVPIITPVKLIKPKISGGHIAPK